VEPIARASTKNCGLDEMAESPPVVQQAATMGAVIQASARLVDEPQDSFGPGQDEICRVACQVAC